MILNIILAILVLSVIIIVHEFGHFIVAKANGVTVLEFSLGFGPKLLHFKKGETEYCLKLLPFGGACMMLGEDFMEGVGEEDDDEDDEENKDAEQSNASSSKDSTIDSSDIKTSSSVSSVMMNDTNKKALENGYDMNKAFANKSVWARIAIIAAGPLFNFILAFILAIVIIGGIGYDPCVVDVVEDNTPATEAGLQAGDTIVSVNGNNMAFAREFASYRYFHASDTMNITYERDGQKYSTVVTPKKETSSAYRMGITISDAIVGEVTKDSPADRAGMKSSDIIKSINGVAVDNSTSISNTIAESNGAEVTVVVDRAGAELTLKVTPEVIESTTYVTGFASYGSRVKASPIQTIGYSFKEVGYWIETVVESVGMMFTGKVSVNDLSGPVGAVSTMSSVVEQSKSEGSYMVFLNLLYFGVMISANLGVMNLLPLPALDGGRLVFFLIEAVRGKPVKKEREGMVHFVGMVLLMILMVYIMFKDIKGLF